MKIRHHWRKIGDISLSNAVENRIRSQASDGVVEAANDTANQAAAEFGKLIELLHAKGVLSDADAKQFIGYEYVVTDD